MRTILAMITALAAALFVSFSISQNIADNVVASYHFESPDQAANWHAGVFVATGFLALLGGFGAGYLLGWPLRRKPPVG